MENQEYQEEYENQEGQEQPSEQYEEPQEPESSYVEPEGEEEVAQEQEPPRKKKSNIGQRLSEVQREKFQALDQVRQLNEEIARMRQEQERLKGVADSSTRTALNHFDEAVKQRLNAAKEKKRKALESGDIDAQTEADVELGLATAEYQEANRLKAQQKMYDDQRQTQDYNNQQPYAQPYETGYQQPYQQQITPEVAYQVQQFSNENPWFDSRSEDYNEEMADVMNYVVRELDSNMARSGYGAYIQNSPEYWEVVNQRARELVQHKRQGMGGDLNMRQTRGPVSGVRQGGFSQGQPQSRQSRLSPEERETAKMLGLDEKTYLQYRTKEERETPWKRQPGYKG